MLVLVTYDVSTIDTASQRRLSRVAKTCLDFGQRVQNSVFECEVDPGQFAMMKAQLLEIINPAQDSLRFYLLGKHGRQRVEHMGAKPTMDLGGPLIV